MGSFATALYDALLSAGIAAERAREVVDLFDRSVDERYQLHLQVLATKSDVAECRAAIVEKLGQLIAGTHVRISETRETLTRSIAETNNRTRDTLDQKIGETNLRVSELGETLTRSIAETNNRFGRLETRIAETKSELMKWMLAALTAQTALLLSLKLI